jgi:hypothetical protein
VVSKPTGKPRGRPIGSRMDLRTDPDRYAVAVGLALQTFGHSQRKAFDLAATATPHCEEIKRQTQFKLGGAQRRHVDFMLIARSGENVAPTVKGRSSVLRQKAMRPYSSEEGRWLRQMAKAIHRALRGRDDAQHLILTYAGSVGELQLALDYLRLPRPN